MQASTVAQFLHNSVAVVKCLLLVWLAETTVSRSLCFNDVYSTVVTCQVFLMEL